MANDNVAELKDLNGSLEYRLSRTGGVEHTDIVEISGTVTARLVQTCVVTTEPVEASITAEFEGIVSTLSNLPEEDEVSDDESSIEGPEFLGEIVDDAFDVGEILSEQEILDVLAYIKSTWPERVIEIHDGINAQAGG